MYCRSHAYAYYRIYARHPLSICESMSRQFKNGLIELRMKSDKGDKMLAKDRDTKCTIVHILEDFTTLEAVNEAQKLHARDGIDSIHLLSKCAEDGSHSSTSSSVFY